MRFALILSLLVAIVAVIFAFENPDPVDVEFLTFQSVPVPLALVIIVSLLAGVLVGTLFSVPNRFRSRGRIKKLEKRIDELEATPTNTAGVIGSSRAAPPPAAPPPTVRTAPPRVEPSGGAAETERLAAETRQMAEDAQRRAAEAERRASDDI